ncbi:histidine kinase-like ATPase [Zopfochytrium polystomum]|nr:histidine kinase-like ATPase [Zopfochytrium polystomum]
MIKAIDKSSVHRICSGQVILDLATAVKELVENSLDAGATTVEVRLREQGADGFDVIDNGKGISADNYETLALKHYTSKITKFEDLDGVNSFGFRGEALSSLCAVSEMTVTTATEEQAPFGARLEFERSGRLKGTTTCAREHGTTVAVRKLFDNLPVRLREFKKNGKKEFSKCLDQVQAYALVSTGVRISCSNQSSKGDRILQVATSGNRTMKENFANVFGTKLLHQILELEFNLTLDSKDGDADEDRYLFRTERIRVTGLISKPLPNYGRSAGDRQFFYINKRPCDLPKLAKVVNEVYRTYNAHQYPMVVLDLQLSPGDFDVNVTPDKRTIFLHREKDLFQALRVIEREKKNGRSWRAGCF